MAKLTQVRKAGRARGTPRHPDERNAVAPPDEPSERDAIQAQIAEANARTAAAEAEIKRLQRESKRESAGGGIAGELAVARAELAEYQERERAYVQKERFDAFTTEVAKMAPGVSPGYLRAMLRGLADEEGLDIYPEVASVVLARRAIDRIKAIDPERFAGTRESSTYWRERGAAMSGRGPAPTAPAPRRSAGRREVSDDERGAETLGEFARRGRILK